jgi:hypothetical protein
MPDGKPLLGWIGDKGDLPAAPLRFPSALLEPKAAATVTYDANLPRQAAITENGTARAKAVRKVGPAQEGSFLSASLPGGQANVIISGGRLLILRVRWQPIGAMSWCCFTSFRGPSGDDAWTPLPHVYAFNAQGYLENHPEPQILKAGSHHLQLVHPEGRLTTLNCSSGLVKLRRFATDGWERRELRRIQLLPDDRIEAEFSDRERLAFAVVASEPAALSEETPLR